MISISESFIEILSWGFWISRRPFWREQGYTKKRYSIIFWQPIMNYNIYIYRVTINYIHGYIYTYIISKMHFWYFKHVNNSICIVYISYLPSFPYKQTIIVTFLSVKMYFIVDLFFNERNIKPCHYKPVGRGGKLDFFIF